MYQYDAHELDSLLRACLTYLEEQPTETYFAVANIAGRDGVDANVDPVKKMLDSIVESDSALIRYNGLGLDGAPYYSLGPNAASVMSTGGFAAYFQRQKRLEFMAQIQSWSPIFISIGALIVSVLAWQIPNSNDEAIKSTNAKVDSQYKEQLKALRMIRSEQERARASVTTLAQDLETLKMSASKQPLRPKDKP